MAILRMRDVYAEARAVFVLDICLEKTGGNLFERRLQLACSEWTRRLWTLEEAMLPRAEKLFIKFKDGITSYDKLCESQRRSFLANNFDESTRVLLHECISTRRDLLNDPLLAIIKSLQRRETSRAEDEPIVLASLLRVPMLQFLENPTMENFFSSVPKLPQTLLFVPGIRLSTPGLRWAPRTFLCQTGHIPVWRDTSGRLSNQGFEVEKPAVLLSPKITLAVPISGDIHFKIRATDQEEQYVLCIDRERILSSQSLGIESVALIWLADIYNGVVVKVVIASNAREENGIHYCHLERHGSIWRESLWKRYKPTCESEYRSAQEITGSYFPSLTFCVD